MSEKGGLVDLASLMPMSTKGAKSWAEDSEDITEAPAPQVKKPAWGAAAAPAKPAVNERAFPTLDSAKDAPTPKEAANAPPGPARYKAPGGASSGSSYGDRRPGGYGDRREGGYGDRREGGYGDRREGGYGDRREGGYGDRREGGYGGDRYGDRYARGGDRGDGGYGDRREGGYGDRREGRYGGDREGGYGERRERPVREKLPVPENPPFVAYVGSLSYQATQEDVAEFFSDLQVTEVRLISKDGQPAGYGYVHFADQESLKAALELEGSTLFDRQVRIDVAAPPKERPQRDGDRRDRGGNGFFGSGRFESMKDHDPSRDAAPRERKPLNLAPRTAPLSGSGSAPSPKKPSEDPFGGATSINKDFYDASKPRVEPKPVEERKEERRPDAPARPADRERRYEAPAAREEPSSWRTAERKELPSSRRGGFAAGRTAPREEKPKDPTEWQQQTGGRQSSRGGFRGGRGGSDRSGGDRHRGAEQEDDKKSASKDAGNAFDVLGETDE